jgi:hypothetical protein
MWAVSYYHTENSGRIGMARVNGQTWGERYEYLLKADMDEPYALFDFASGTEISERVCLGTRNCIGTQSPELFHRFLRQADLPVIVTGDASLSEAISASKVFIYQFQIHKRNLIRQMYRFAKEKLTSAEYDLFRSFGGTKFFGDRISAVLFQEKMKVAFQKFSDAAREHLDIYKTIAQLIEEGLRNLDQVE